MKSRGRPFRPAALTLAGIDLLEYRYLMSAMARVAEMSGDDRTLEAARTAVRAAAATEAREAVGLPDSVSADVSVSVWNEDASQKAPIAVISRAAATLPGATTGVGLSDPTESTPVDDLSAGSATGPSVAEQAGDLSFTIGATGTSQVGSVEGANTTSTTFASGSWSARTGAAPPVIAVLRQQDASSASFGSVTEGVLLTIASLTFQPGLGPTNQAPPSPGSDVEVDAERSGDAPGGRSTAAEVSLFSKCADLITDFLPRDGGTLEDAIDRFLAPVADASAELANSTAPTSLIPTVTGIILATLATESVRRRIRGDEANDEGDPDLAWSLDHPAFWRLGGS